MAHRVLLSLLIIALLLIVVVVYPHQSRAQTAATVISGKFYRFDIVAENGATNFVELPNPPSLNDRGTVSFNVRIGGGGGWALYKRPAGQQLQLVNVFNGFNETHGHSYGQVTSINSFGSVFVRRSTTATGNPNAALQNSYIQQDCTDCGIAWANDNPTHNQFDYIYPNGVSSKVYTA